MLRKILLFGNSGSGKTTLARKLSDLHGLAHLDLDTIAWKPVSPPERLPIDESKNKITHFIGSHTDWVIEGCYTDLLSLVVEKSTEIVFMNLPTSLCIENARNRKWEPHKYESKEAQDANLNMLCHWIAEYERRSDTFSFAAHLSFYEQYSRDKTMIVNNYESARKV